MPGAVVIDIFFTYLIPMQAVTTVEGQTEDLLQFLLVCGGTHQIIKIEF